MRETARSFVLVAEAALVVTAACFALSGLQPLLPRAGEEVLGMLMAFVPTSLTAWWIFRRLCTRSSRRHARAVAIAFGVFAPVGLVVGLAVAQIPGSYADIWFGRPFGLVGAFVGVLVATFLVSFIPSAAAVWLTRRLSR